MSRDVLHEVENFDRLPDCALIDEQIFRRLLCMSESGLRRHVLKGLIPNPKKVGGKRKWTVGEAREALAKVSG